jgi:ABC-2 type transport system ATP-binding protein
MTSAITAAGLRKSYGTQTVLEGIDLDIAAGTVTVAGHDLARDPDGVRATIGLTGQFEAVDGLLTGEENLRLMAKLRHLGVSTGRRRVAELLERFDLVDAARKPLACAVPEMLHRA